MQTNINMTVWFEIPAINFERAVQFYQTILDVEIDAIEMAGMKQGLLPHDDPSKVSGAIVCGMDLKPSTEGSTVYLNGEDDLNTVLNKVEPAGGKVFMAKTHLGDNIGHIAQFIDSEGNRVGLHSMQ